MAWHLYLMPLIGSGAPTIDPRRPKYAVAGTARMMHFGHQAVYLLAADLDATADAALVANADVTKIPDNLDQLIGAALATVQAKLSAVNIPFGWVTSGMSYRTMLRVIIPVFIFMQHFHNVTQIAAAIMNGTTVTLNTQFNALSAAVRQGLLDTAASFNFSTTGFTGTSTVGQILKGVADQYGDQPITIGGINI